MSEVASILKVSRTTAYSLADQGVFRTIQLGTGRNALRVPTESIERLLSGDDET
jgi:hypothetical protein